MSYVMRRGMGDVVYTPVGDAYQAQYSAPQNGIPIGEIWDIYTQGTPMPADVETGQQMRGGFSIIDTSRGGACFTGIGNCSIIAQIAPGQDPVAALQAAGLPVLGGANLEFTYLWNQAWQGAQKNDLAAGRISGDDLRSQIIAAMRAKGFSDAALAQLANGQSTVATPDLRPAQPAPMPDASAYQSSLAAGNQNIATLHASGAFSPGSSYYVKPSGPSGNASGTPGVTVSPALSTQGAGSSPSWFTSSMLGGIPNWTLVLAAGAFLVMREAKP